MGIENHNRLDRVLHTEEYISMKCGSAGYIIESPGNAFIPTSLKRTPEGDYETEKKYCCNRCPVLVAEILAEESHDSRS